MVTYLVIKVMEFFGKCALTIGPKRIDVCARRIARSSMSLGSAIIEIVFLLLESDYAMHMIDVVVLAFMRYCKNSAIGNPAYSSDVRNKINKSIYDIIVRMRKFKVKYGI